MSSKSVPIEHLQSLVDGRTFKIGDFDLLPTVGTGSFGRVRLVKLKGGTDRSPFALKMLRKKHILKERQTDHVKAEAQILIRLKHPFVVNLLTVFQDDRRLCLLLEYVNGGELFCYLRRVEKIKADHARFYAGQITLAFQYIHSKEVAYRDLKPENMLLDCAGNVKVTDFGFAVALEGRTFTLCGTPEYMAPEIIQSKGHGKPVDWWALGVLIFEMMAGYPPFFDDKNAFGIYQRVMAGRIEFPEWFAEDSKDLIKGLLTLDRKKRMGHVNNGDDIKSHRWFSTMDWERLYQRKVKAPYVPNVRSADDLSMFDKYQESEGDNWEAVTPEEDLAFIGFDKLDDDIYGIG